MYRYLEVGETIQEGDEGTALCNRLDLSKMSDEEFLNSEDKKCGWQKCSILTGQKIKTDFALHCRRKIVPEVKFYRTISGNYIKRYQDNKCDYFIPEQNMFSTSCGWSHIHDCELKKGYYKEGYYKEISEEEYFSIIAVWQDKHKQAKETAMNPEKQTMLMTDFGIDTNRPLGKTVQTVKTYGFKAANYFIFEPAVHIGKPILKSIRYILFVGGLTAGIYGMNNPELVSNTVKSCLPKVSIQAPDILR
jgi:hypothetical protein